MRTTFRDERDWMRRYNAKCGRSLTSFCSSLLLRCSLP